jgi:hypothetical protein
MLRRTPCLAIMRGHLAPTQPKHTDRPGVWGAQGGDPRKDTLAKRWEFAKFISMNKMGKLTKPFRTKKAVWYFRIAQARAWKSFVFAIAGFIVLLIGNIWCLLLYQAYSVGASTPVLERKVREHRISKQILGMVREREKDLTLGAEQAAAHKVLDARKKAAAA